MVLWVLKVTTVDDGVMGSVVEMFESARKMNRFEAQWNVFEEW